MGLNVAVLERSFNFVVPRAEHFTTRVFERLIENYPRFESLFLFSDMAEHHRRFNAALVMIVQNLRHPVALADVLHSLGARHIENGARPVDFAAFGENLLAVLQEFCGPKWNAETAKAWREAIEWLSARMRRAGRTAAPLVSA